jgi:hypothetical protein
MITLPFGFAVYRQTFMRVYAMQQSPRDLDGAVNKGGYLLRCCFRRAN